MSKPTPVYYPSGENLSEHDLIAIQKGLNNSDPLVKMGLYRSHHMSEPAPAYSLTVDTEPSLYCYVITRDGKAHNHMVTLIDESFDWNGPFRGGYPYYEIIKPLQLLGGRLSLFLFGELIACYDRADVVTFGLGQLDGEVMEL